MEALHRRALTLLGVLLLSVNLSACIVAAVPLIMAAGAVGVAATGFVVYKSVQTTGGGTVRVAFGSNDSKHLEPPHPLPAGASVAVWASEDMARKAAGAIQASGKFSQVQWDPGPAPTAQDARRNGYDDICRRQNADIVFTTVDEGETVKSNMLSFKRGAVIHKLSLEGFGCATQQIVWVDSMAVIVEASKDPVPQGEIDAAAGQAWGERIVAAKG
jgi:hypothetical protein